MIDYAGIEIGEIEYEAKLHALGILMSGSNNSHDEIAQRVGHYLREYWRLDPARWTWRVFTPWRGGVLASWGFEDIGITLEVRSAVEQLAALT